MADNSNIEWTDSTFNPWIGCTKVSLGCDHCYAATQDKFRSWTPEGWGGPRKRTAATTWRKPELWNDEPFSACTACGWRGESRESRLLEDGNGTDLICPTCGHIGLSAARRRVFCASLADVFDNQVDPQWRLDLYDLIRATPNLDWLLLTKRIGNVNGWGLPITPDGDVLPNIWLGATVVSQEEADRDIPKLLATPARVRFLSMEPLLGPVDLDRLARAPSDADRAMPGFADVARLFISALHGQHGIQMAGGKEWFEDQASPRLDWVIVGGESGGGARRLQLQWVRDLVRKCRGAGVPVLVKQLGREVLDDGMSSPGEHWPPKTVRQHVPRYVESDPGFNVRLNDRKGGDWLEWPEDLRVRQFPEVR